MIHTGDCIPVMAGMEPDSVDSIVTDPPYGLAFMGKSWDTLTPQRFGQWCEAWGREALRVAKPGGYLLAFGGTRTHHRLVCGLEDAGWIIRDELDWIYASGFPKGKANLKPAHEPIVLARKPGPLQPLNIDECRIPSVTIEGAGLDVNTHLRPSVRRAVGESIFGTSGTEQEFRSDPQGRWPSNVLLSDPALFDEPNPEVVGSGATVASGSRNGTYAGGGYRGDWPDVSASIEGDSGGYARFFIIPKADRADREPVVRGQLTTMAAETPERLADGQGTPSESASAAIAFGNRVCRNCGHGQFDGRREGACCDAPDYISGQVRRSRENAHPTVKPVDLMRHLVRLVTPSGGTVLDPFLGSGSTALAAEQEGLYWIGIEKEPEYVAIAEARLHYSQKGMGL